MHDKTPVHGGIGLQKDSELREFMNHNILKMAEGGVLRRIDTTWGIKVGWLSALFHWKALNRQLHSSIQHSKQIHLFHVHGLKAETQPEVTKGTIHKGRQHWGDG